MRSHWWPRLSTPVGVIYPGMFSNPSLFRLHGNGGCRIIDFNLSPLAILLPGMSILRILRADRNIARALREWKDTSRNCPTWSPLIKWKQHLEDCARRSHISSNCRLHEGATGKWRATTRLWSSMALFWDCETHWGKSASIPYFTRHGLKNDVCLHPQFSPYRITPFPPLLSISLCLSMSVCLCLSMSPYLSLCVSLSLSLSLSLCLPPYLPTSLPPPSSSFRTTLSYIFEYSSTFILITSSRLTFSSHSWRFHFRPHLVIRRVSFLSPHLL